MSYAKRIILFAALLACIMDVGRLKAEQHDASLSVRDMIRFAVVGDPEATDQGGGGYNTIQWITRHWVTFSPDGKNLAVIVRHGDLGTNETEASIDLFLAKDLLKHPVPRVVAHFASNSNMPPIAHLRWLKDNRTLVGIGERPSAPPELYRIDTKTNSVSTITRVRAGIASYDISADGKRIAFLAPALQSIGRHDRRGFGDVIESTSLADALGLSNGGNTNDEKSMNLFVIDLRTGKYLQIQNPATVATVGARNIPPISLGSCRDDAGLSISPDGRFAMRTCTILYPPPRWRQYAWSSDQTLDRGLDPNSSPNWRNQHVIYDLQTGKAASALDAPLPAAGWSGPVSWMPRGHMALIANVLIPNNANHSTYNVIALDVSTGRIETILSGPIVSALMWDNQRSALRIQAGKIDSLNGIRVVKTEALLFRRVPAGWTEVGEAPAINSNSNGKIDLSLHESINTPPTLWASTSNGKRSALVLDPNPWLRRKRLGHVEPISWKAFGQQWSGGLYLPPGYEQGRRYPLVIQTHGFDADRFSLYGRSTSAFAAQSLASSDIIVLQVNDLSVEGLERSKPGKEQIARLSQTIAHGYESAVDVLVARGFVDPERVGIIGWSATCRYVKYFLTHTNYLVQAATISDGYDAGYIQFLAFPNLQPYIADDMGVAPYDDRNGPWAENWGIRNPDFRPEFVHAPVRIEALGGQSALLAQWEFFAGLRSLNAPVELYYQSRGAHEAIEPRYWYGSAQGNVDWFRFWLQGHEDPAPTKRMQYLRWEHLCDLHRARNPTRPTFCVPSRGEVTKPPNSSAVAAPAG